jgi:hypothetical protein
VNFDIKHTRVIVGSVVLWLANSHCIHVLCFIRILEFCLQILIQIFFLQKINTNLVKLRIITQQMRLIVQHLV